MLKILRFVKFVKKKSIYENNIIICECIFATDKVECLTLKHFLMCEKYLMGGG